MSGRLSWYICITLVNKTDDAVTIQTWLPLDVEAVVLKIDCSTTQVQQLLKVRHLIQ